MQPYDSMGDRGAILQSLGFPVAQAARVYTPGTVLGSGGYERDYHPLGFPVREVRTAPYGSFMRGAGLGGLGDACPSSWLDPFSDCECPAGTVSFAGKEGIFTCLPPSALPKKPDGGIDFSQVLSFGGKAINWACQHGWTWGCPKVATGAGGTVVVTPAPWYATTWGILGILAGAAAVGTGVYLVARK